MRIYSVSVYHFMSCLGDGNMISWKGTPKQRDDRVWKTDKTAVSADYFLGLSCDKKYIGIYKGTPSAPRDTIWTERTGSSSPPFPTPRPPPAGPTPTGSRPRINFKGKDYCTSRNPCSLCEGDCDVSGTYIVLKNDSIHVISHHSVWFLIITSG